MGSWVSITKHPEMVGLKPILTLNRLGGGGGAFDKFIKNVNYFCNKICCRIILQNLLKEIYHSSCPVI